MAPSLTANLIEAAERAPERLALIHGDSSTSYLQLAERSLAIATHLKNYGLRPGQRVALLLPSTWHYVAAYYGALMAGGIVVGLNTAAKAHDLAGWLEHCDATWLFADAANPEVAPAVAMMARPPQLVVLNGAVGHAQEMSFAQALSASPGVAAPPEPTEDAPAAIIYTSGTTGAPKGVTLSHGNLASNVETIARYLSLTDRDCTVSVLPFFYSYGNSVLHTHIKAGAALVLEPSLVYPQAIPEAIARHQASGFSGVPSTYALLLNRLRLADHDLSSLRYLTQAGGAMSPELTRRLRSALPHAQLFVMYGQTEATARLTYLPPRDIEEKLGSVGRPLEAVEIEIRHDDGSALAAGASGEVWVKGPNVMLGYWRDEAANAQVLKSGWLKTGDMGYLDPDGYLFLHGRRSDMIKTGAHRVHPLDIERVIAELPQVAEVAVCGIDDELLGQIIKAFVVLTPGATLNAMAIKGRCRERLANYKIPKSVEFVPSLPKTASGKVRRHELPQRNTA